MQNLFKFAFVAIAFVLFSFSSVEASGLPGGSEKKNPATQVTDSTQTSKSEIAPSLFRRRGNVIGYTEITIDLGVLKIKRVRVDCDGDPEVRCVYKKGEQILASNQLLTTYEVPSKVYPILSTKKQ
ncbi:MAG: hypothetical protein JJT94_13600 [Bernardetiaceae bacterium]|nr:hypothetical protein [Bernardetiaceae bacterium]